MTPQGISRPPPGDIKSGQRTKLDHTVEVNAVKNSPCQVTYLGVIVHEQEVLADCGEEHGVVVPGVLGAVELRLGVVQIVMDIKTKFIIFELGNHFKTVTRNHLNARNS